MQKELRILTNQKLPEFEFFDFARLAPIFRGEGAGWPQLQHPALEAYQLIDWASNGNPMATNGA
jgi:hypothetical protein